ncbi:hypothetical protein BH09PSE3_BH09PSE3_26620 [soil metagenome]
MAITRQDETELITTVYEGILEQPHWTTFLSRLRGRLRADSARLLVARTGPLDMAAEGFATPAVTGSAVQGDLIDAYRRTAAPFLLIRPNRAYAEDELSELFPIGAGGIAQPKYRRLVRVSDDGGTSAWLQVSRAASAFGAADGALLTQIAPHLAIALRTLTTMRRTQAREAAASHGLGMAGVGWLRLDRRGHVIDWNDEADCILRTVTPQWRTREGQLRVGVVAADVMVARAFSGVDADRRRQPLIIRISTAPVVDIAITPPGDADAVTTVAYVRSAPRRDTDADAVTLMALFGLPLSEARLAARLAGGESIAEAATGLGLTLETARNYSKRLYAKTGTRGQADLVRVVLETIMVFTPPVRPR